MVPRLPICCSPGVFDALTATLDNLEAAASLVHGAVAISRLEIPKADVKQTQQQIAQLASAIAGRVHGPQPQALVAHLHDYLFDECHFAGNSADYYNPCNSFLPWVIEHRTGLPITLSLLYRCVAEALGLRVHGIGLPGHFIVGIELDDSLCWIDPFSAGKMISEEEARARMTNQFGKQVEWSNRFAEPVNNRYWLTRILQNLLTAYGRRNQHAKVAAVLEMELLLWPDETRLQRDLAVLLARVGKTAEATHWLDYYLANNPDDPQRSDLRQLIANLT